MENINNEEPKEDEVLKELIKSGREYRPKSFAKYIYSTFFWCMMGVSFIYGFRLFYDDPPSPSFMPIIGGVFSAILSFTLVIALEHVIGPITIKFGENFNFTGASGPIVLWCICFLVIVFGLYLLGIGEVSKNYSDYHRDACSVGDLIFHECPRQVKK